MITNDKKWKVAIATVLIASSLVITAPNTYAAATFKDLKKGSFSYNEVVDLANRGIIGGYADGTYKPSQAVTRGQSAKLLAEVLELDLENVKDPKYKDVPKTHPYYKHIAALANKKIISGYKNGNFGPNDKLKRNQMAKILSESFDFNTSAVTKLPFKDVDVKGKEAKYIQALLDMNITNGTTPTTFSPNGIVTRGQMATFIHRSDKATNGTYANTTIKELKNGSLITPIGTYSISDSLKKSLLAASNASALVGAEVELRLVGGTVSEVNNIVINASGDSVTHKVLDGGNNKISGKVTIQGDNILLKNLDIAGDFIIGSGVQNSFEAQNVKVSGTTTLNNSTSNSNARAEIVFNDTTLNNLFIDKKSTVILENKTTVKDIQISQNTKVIAEDTTKLVNVDLVKAANEVELNGNITNLTIESTGTSYIAGTGNITNMIADTPSKLTILTTGKVSKLLPARRSWIELGTNTNIVNLEIPLGMEGNEIIENFTSALPNIQQINGKKNTEYIKPGTTPKPPVVTNPNTGQGDATTVSNLIDAIDRNKSTYIADIRAARTAYNALAPKVKTSVRNLTTLEVAESTIVSNYDQLKEALKRKLGYIILGNNITLTEYVKLDYPIEIHGNGKVITLQHQSALTDTTRNTAILVQANNVSISHLTIDVAVSKNAPRIQSQPMYIGLEIDDKTGIILDDMIFRNGHAGLFINAKTNNVQVSATNITTNNNSVGGIGANISTTNNVKLQIKADGNTHTPLKPAIWKEGSGTINITDGRYIESIVGNEVHFYKQP